MADANTEPLSEPVVLPVEEFESPSERERREWITAGGDIAYFICRFLQGNRKREISLSEITGTRLYARSNDAERRALQFICAQVKPIEPSEHDSLQLRIRDAALADFAERKHVRADWAVHLRGIPAAIRKRQEFDRATFARQYHPPVGLFEWIGCGVGQLEREN